MWYVALRPLNVSVISFHLTTKQQHLFPSKMILQEVLTRKIAKNTNQGGLAPRQTRTLISQPSKLKFLLGRHLATNSFGLGKLFYKSSRQL